MIEDRASFWFSKSISAGFSIRERERLRERERGGRATYPDGPPASIRQLIFLTRRDRRLERDAFQFDAFQLRNDELHLVLSHISERVPLMNVDRDG